MFAGSVFLSLHGKYVLTPRLACMAALVPPNARLADIGTDHGKLPISLLLDGHIASAIGSDIRSGPLAHAQRNAKEHNVSLSLRLAPGLEAARAEEARPVTIAGMGGQTIAEILTAATVDRPRVTICCCSSR